MPGKLKIRQPEAGYRFSIDALILAWHLEPSRRDNVIDIGTGCGVIPLIVANRFPGVFCTGIEIQKELADCAAENVRSNRLDGRIRIENADIRAIEPLLTDPADWISCNPPHTAKDAGRINPNLQRAIARHEIMMTVSDLTSAASRLLKPSGRLLTIYPAARMEEIKKSFLHAGFSLSRTRNIVFKEGQAPTRCFIEALPTANAPLESLPDLVIHSADGSCTGQAKALFESAAISGGDATA
jgi:tRNA1Val (adenine37-N6)-methyltransferase